METLAHNPFMRIAHKSLVYLLVFCIVNMPVWAISGGDVIQGSAGLAPGNDYLVNLTSGRAVINWDDFDTLNGQGISFTGPGSFAVLNRVIAGGATSFDGYLNGNQGHILLINPQGIVFGPHATISAARFTASTMHLVDDDDFSNFMSGSNTFEFAKAGGDPAAQIELLAGSSVTAERVDLLAQQIVNAGTITTETGGVVVMAAGDSVFLGEAGSDVLVQMSGIEDGMITNYGTVEAPEGTIVMAAGDIFSTPLGLKVLDGAGKVAQNGTLDVDGTLSGTGDGGSVEILAGEDISIGADSLITVNAIPDGDPQSTDRPDGGDIIIESTETVNIDPGAIFSAKGNGWYDVDQNFRFDFGVDTSFSGSIQIFGKYLNLSSPDDYIDPTEFSDHFDLLGYNVGPLQQLQSGVLTVGNNEGDMTVAEGPLPGSSAENTVYEEWIENVSLVGVHIDTLSSGDITFEDLNLGDSSDLGLIGGAGNMSFRTKFDTGGIVVSDLTDIIGTLDGGDIFMVAGSGGITTGVIGIRNEDKTGDPGQIILATANGGDISTLTLDVSSGNHEIISVSSSGDVTIDGGVFVATNEVPDALDKTATAEICIQAGDDINITGPIDADSHGKVSVLTDIHIDAGLNPESNDEGESQAGIINIDLQGGQIFAKSEVSGPDPDDQGSGDLTSIATIEIHTSAVDEDGQKAINITNGKAGGNQAVQVRAKVQGKSPVGVSLPANDSTDYEENVSGPDGGVNKTQFAKIEIQSGYDVSVCDDCVPPPFLPPQPEFFFVKNDAATLDWRAGYTVIGDQTYDPADLDVLFNDNGPDVPLFSANIIGADGNPIVLITEKGGTLEWVQFEYTDGDGVIHTYDGFVYTPPSYTEDFEWDGISDYATFTDSFQYRAQIGDDVSLNIATVTLTVQNEVPTLTPDSDSIHMNTSADFDLSSLVTDNDGTPGELTGEFTGTYGDLTYGIVEGLIPVADGSIETDSGSIPDTLTISDDTITYAPLEGYVSPGGAATTFGYSVVDENIVDDQGEPVEQTESLEVTVTNTLPEGDSWLGTTQMDTALNDASLEKDGFTDTNGDAILGIEVDGVSNDDYNGSFGGSLTYDGSDYDYDPTSMGLPGYAGDEFDDFDTYPVDIATNADDRFDVKLWDGQRTYYEDGTSTVLSTDYGEGTISVDITSELPEGDAGFGQVHMDSQGVTQDLEFDFESGITVEADSYTGSVIDSDLYGGTLVYDADADTWTYSTDTDLPGYIGDDNDDFGQGGYVADDLFTVNLSNGEFDYWLSEDPVPDGYEQYEYADGQFIYRKAVFSDGTGTVSVDITNELPTIDENTTIEHMDEDILNQLFAEDHLDGNPINELDDLATLDGDGNPTVTYTTDFGIAVTITQESDGSLSYTYEPLPGYADEDSFDVTVWDGQRDYVFVDGEIASDDPVTVNGSVSLEYTNNLPEGNGDLGSTESGTPLVVGQDGTTSPVLVIDIPDLPQQDIDDVLSIPNGTYTGSAGGTLVYDGTNWTYTPAPGFSGTETFEIDVWDGEYDYANIEERTPVFGQGIVTVTVSSTPPPEPTPTPVPEPLAPIAPLADYEVPKLVGCPAEIEAAANELAINSDELQLLIANAMATNPNLQPCDACQNLLEAATALKSINQEQMDALVLVFNTAAPIDQAFSPEMSASLATAFSNFRELETQLATVSPEDYEQYQQYTMVDELVEAFVSYVAVLDNDLRLPVGDSMALVMERYFEPIEASGNPNIGAYLIEQMQAVQTVTE